MPTALFSAINPITPENNFGYQHIFRTDTNNYTTSDVLHETEEWTDIIHQIIEQTPYYYIKVVEFSGQMSTTLACTGRRRGRTLGYVRINQEYLKYHTVSQNFHNTLCHETIHTFPGCHNHGECFKNLGRIMGMVVPGIHINRTSIGDPGYMAYIQRKKADRHGGVQYKYAAICTQCGVKVTRERRCALINTPEHYRCGRCGGKFRVEEYRANGDVFQYQTLSI